MDNQRCFVIQGFGVKQDYEQGKQFDLDASYDVIKEAMEDIDISCYRADELRRNAMIEKIMYDELLRADLVIADITTLNFNAAYELGVRLAFRPYATIIVGEEGMNFPFDINHVYIHSYQHLGKDIGRKEAQRFQKELKQLARQALTDKKSDSPIYEFLEDLPAQGILDCVEKKPLGVLVEPINENKRFVSAAIEQEKLSDKDDDISLKIVTDLAQEMMKTSNFASAIPLWERARNMVTKNDFITQKLALATYKSEQPTREEALVKAKDIIKYMKPRLSFDTETLGLWASVHKRLYMINRKPEDLKEAVFALERGFFVKQDYYTGINLAFMLDTQAEIHAADEKKELHAMARYVRRKVKRISHEELEKDTLKTNDKYWVLATLYQACVGLGEEAEAQVWKQKADQVAKEAWMVSSTEEQIDALRKLLA